MNVHYVSPSPNHCLIDFSKLILNAHKSTQKTHLYIHSFSAPSFRLGNKVEQKQIYYGKSFQSLTQGNIQIPFSYPQQAMPLSEVLNLFDKYASEAKVSNENPQHALDLLKNRISEKYYRGFCGKIRKILNQLCGCFDFNQTEVAKKIEAISQKISILPKKVKLPKEKFQSIESTAVFTKDSKDINALGALADFRSGYYSVKWMSPKEFLQQVDPYFRVHCDEDSMPWIFRQMKNLIQNPTLTPKFSPLMMNPKKKARICDGYSILFHEGRHRALAAIKLGIPQVPICIPTS